MNKAIYTNFDRLRLPLILLVVFIHARFSVQGMENEVTAYGIVSHFFTLAVSQVAVPLFFFISGCLYFRDYSEFSASAYLKKQKRRLSTLVVPFFLWNTLFWLLFTCFKQFLPSFTNGGIPSLTTASYSDVLWAFWGNSTGGPIDFPLWFIRDLITVTFLSPLIYYFLLRFKIGFVFLLLLVLCWFFSYPVLFLGNDICKCVCFFSLGSYLNKSLSSESIRNRMKKFYLGGGRFYIVGFLLLGVISTLNHYIWNNSTLSLISNRLIVLDGLIAMYCIVDRNCSLFDKFTDLIPSGCVFFIFAAHGFLITFIKRVIEKFSIENQAALILLYFVVVLSTVMICVALYKVAKAVSPKAMTFFTGR